MKNEPISKELFGKFQASRKRLIKFEDLLPEHGDTMLGWNLNNLAAVHVYENGQYIMESNPKWCKAAYKIYSLDIGTESWDSEHLEELEQKLFTYLQYG